MRVADGLNGPQPSLSFEFFPPRDDVGFWDLYRTVESLRPLQPNYVSVTYGAGGSTRRQTLELVRRIKNDIGIEAVAHLTCVGSTQDELLQILDQLKQSGIENVLALRGDPPKGESTFRPVAGGLQYANELVTLIRHRWPSCCIGAACYPEGHPECPNREQDLENLKRKVDAGVDFLITQLFFDDSDFFRFRDVAARAGIRQPILAGIMPIQSLGQVQRFTKMCGASIPKQLELQLSAVADNAEAVRHIGMYHATQQCLDLVKQGVAGIHFYTLNKSTATRAIFQFLSSSIGRDTRDASA